MGVAQRYYKRYFLRNGPLATEDEEIDGGNVLRVGTAGVACAAAVP